MTKTMRLARGMLYAVAAVISVLAMVWLFSPKLLRFQADYIGMTHEALPPEVASLFLILYKTIGSSMLAIGVGLALLTWKPFCKGETWSRWTIAVVVLIWAVPYTIGSIQLGAPMFVVPAASIALTGLALLLTRSSNG